MTNQESSQEMYQESPASPESIEVVAPVELRHCWHTGTRDANCCDYCCWCGYQRWTRQGGTGAPEDWPSTSPHGAHFAGNRVPDIPQTDVEACPLRIKIAAREQAKGKGE